MLHIICLALSLALHHLAPVLQGHRRVMIAMDNTSVVSYINKQGDTVLIPSSSSSGPIPVATLPGHSSSGETQTGLPQCECRPSVQALSANRHGIKSSSEKTLAAADVHMNAG